MTRTRRVIEDLCASQGVTWEELTGRCRKQKLSVIRHYLWVMLQDMGVPVSHIAHMANRSHSTIITAIKMTRGCMEVNDRQLRKVENDYLDYLAEQAEKEMAEDERGQAE